MRFQLIGFSTQFAILQGSFATLWVCITPSIKTGPANPKISTGFAGITDLLSVLEHSKSTLNVAVLVRHEYFIHPKSENLQEVSQETVHIYTFHKEVNYSLIY